ncbi:MAG: hypothetical protein ACJASY_001982, partial [Halioglobus sp.]
GKLIALIANTINLSGRNPSFLASRRVVMLDRVLIWE